MSIKFWIPLIKTLYICVRMRDYLLKPKSVREKNKLEKLCSKLQKAQTTSL